MNPFVSEKYDSVIVRHNLKLTQAQLVIDMTVWHLFLSYGCWQLSTFPLCRSRSCSRCRSSWRRRRSSVAIITSAAVGTPQAAPAQGS